ncbi:hypothetical protein F2P44_05880 [Massilia sp. CCM 8695]|uniref:Uncharacterized protein n=1 Tax=Massilia frigida TaxID=2609281 RepID=A0ABX0N7F9_9BURK|nr:hypothetical protein [Massilia frigida]NHZ78809.1 hypothetical protein [Massilia frigida]
MNGLSREEIEARLAAQKGWTEARVSAIDMDVKTLIMCMDERDARMAERDQREAERRAERDRLEAEWRAEQRAERARLEAERRQQQIERDRLEAERRAEFEKRLDVRFAHIEQTGTKIKADMKDLKKTVIITAITATMATVFGVAAFNATLLSGMITSFESGKSATRAQGGKTFFRIPFGSAIKLAPTLHALVPR